MRTEAQLRSTEYTARASVRLRSASRGPQQYDSGHASGQVAGDFRAVSESACLPGSVRSDAGSVRLVVVRTFERPRCGQKPVGRLRRRTGPYTDTALTARVSTAPIIIGRRPRPAGRTVRGTRNPTPPSNLAPPMKPLNQPGRTHWPNRAMVPSRFWRFWAPPQTKEAARSARTIRALLLGTERLIKAVSGLVYVVIVTDCPRSAGSPPGTPTSKPRSGLK